MPMIDSVEQEQKFEVQWRRGRHSCSDITSLWKGKASIDEKLRYAVKDTEAFKYVDCNFFPKTELS
jgi:hypothetical protein